MLRAATGALCPNAVPELSCPSPNKIPLSSGADWGGTKRSPFITASRSHLASACGECRHRHPAPPRRREPGEQGRARESRGEQGRAAAGGQHPQQPLLPGARAERGAVGTSVRPQQSAPALCFSPHCLLRRAGARESTECDQDKSHTTLW